MRWSWKIGEISGIGVYMHATFLLLIGWIALSSWLVDGSLEAVVTAVGFVLALFACVVLHEFGHSLAARKFGISTRDVTLLPIGGVARLERMPDDPRQELWVALAGPAVNVVIAVVLYLFLAATGGLAGLTWLGFTGSSFTQRLLSTNVLLVLFNLLPAFPMDGGRVVRSLLAMRMEYVRATQIAATLGQSMAFLFGFIGLFANPFLLFIALFVWIGAGQEASAAQMRSNLSGIPVSSAMQSDFRTLQPTDTLADAVRMVLSGSQQDFPVMDNGRVAGILTRGDMLVGLGQGGQDWPVSQVMRRGFQTVDSSDMLETASQRLQECNCHTMPVVHDGRLVGLMTMENLGEYLMIRAALSKGKTRRGAATHQAS